MNYHSDEWIMAGVQRHYDEALKHYRPEQIVFMFYTGSANYNADYEKSDIDTWAIVIEDEYIEEQYGMSCIKFNDEVIFFCDIRAYINGIYYSDWAYLPGLYAKYLIINPRYQDFITLLQEKREQFAYNSVFNSVRKALAVNFNFHRKNFFNIAADCTPYYKRLYYCFQILMHINIYKYKEPYASQFYNDDYGVELRKIKMGTYSYLQCRKMLNSITREIESFHPAQEDYPGFEEVLLPLIQDIKVKLLERYENGYSDKN